MRQLIASVINKISLRLSKISSAIYISPSKKILADWTKQKGEEKRLRYDLSPDSIVYDVGGYEGQWASDIFSKYLCTIHIFEPVSEFSSKIAERFVRNSKIIVHPFGLSDSNTSTEISVEQDSSSTFRKGTVTELIQLRDIIEVIKEEKTPKIDLMKINIEGGEYALLEKLIVAGLQKHIANIQIQFHNVIPEAEKRAEQIRKELRKTHSRTYFFHFVWENWQLKK